MSSNRERAYSRTELDSLHARPLPWVGEPWFVARPAGGARPRRLSRLLVAVSSDVFSLFFFKKVPVGCMSVPVGMVGGRATHRMLVCTACVGFALEWFGHGRFDVMYGSLFLRRGRGVGH
jgi:hypothetical protein